MNKYFITSLTECSLRFTTIESAKTFADRNGIKVCQVYYLDGNEGIFLGYGLENEGGLMNGNEFTFV